MLSFTVICGGLLTAAFPASAGSNPFDEQKTYSQTVTEDFESGVLPESVISNGAHLSIDSTGRGTGTGALSVTPTSSSHSVFVMFGGHGGINYQVSILSKNANLTNLRIKIWSKTESGDYTSQEVLFNAKNMSDSWKKLSGDFLCSSDSVGIGYMEIFSLDNVAYLLDEIIITPVLDNSVIKEGNLVRYSSFDTEDDIKNLRYYTSRNSLSVGPGADGTAGSLHVQAKGTGWANVMQDADLRVGRQYKVSFWAKANDEATAGLPIQLVIDRSRRTDPSAPQWAQPSDPNYPTIQSTWTKHEFIYQCKTATTDTGLPYIYFRVGSKATDVLDYCVDELVIEEVPDSYEVDVNAQLYGDSFESSVIIFSVNGYLNSVGTASMHRTETNMSL